jgi:hypothetical protein
MRAGGSRRGAGSGARPRALAGVALILVWCAASGPPPAVLAQVRDQVTDVAALEALAARFAREAAALRTPLYADLLARKSGAVAALRADRSLELMGITPRGAPLFYGIHNLDAARTISTHEVWPGGSTGLDLDGANAPGQLAVWDAGGVRLSHQEFGGRVTQGDAPNQTHYHATHVAGTMIAAGVNAEAHGLSGAALLTAYDWTEDKKELALAAAAGLLVSNHSYGSVCGWYQSPQPPYDYYWFGDITIDPQEDPGFGYYSANAQAFDEIAAAAPYLLICKSAGNDRNDTGPPGGTGHWYWDPVAMDYVWSYTFRPPDGGVTGFDTIPYLGNAKNILTVGAVHDIPAGYGRPEDVEMSVFSGWGPTDDGRIKPDVVANGVAVFSSVNSNDHAYETLGGTSMAAPTVSGSLNLLAMHHRTTHDGQSARAATLKALVIHTADEAGLLPGPDYRNGWGLMNTAAAVLLVDADGPDPDRILEDALAAGETDTFRFFMDAERSVRLTMAWTDPAGTSPEWDLDPPDLMLVNDLDLRLVRVPEGDVFEPWVLNPAAPTAPALPGDNDRDNVEQIHVEDAEPGEYLAIVTCEGDLTGVQAYSLIQTGFQDPLGPEPLVSNVAFAQRRDGSGLVDVTFHLFDGDTPTLTVGLEASADGGATWDLVVATLSGDVGAGVATGIVWDFAADNPGFFGTGCVVRVTADDGD